MPVREREAPCSSRQASEATVRDVDPGALAEVPGRLAGGGGADHLVAGGLEAGPHRGQRRRLAGAGHADHDVEAVAGCQQADRHLPLGVGERCPEALLEPATASSACSFVDLGALAAGEALGQLGDARLVGEHAACRPRLLSASGHDRQPDRVAWPRTAVTASSSRETGRPCRCGAAATITSARGEGLLAGQAPARSEQLAGKPLEVDLGRW